MSSAQSAMSSPSSVSLVRAILDEVFASVIATSLNLDEAANSNPLVEDVEEMEPLRPTTSRPRRGGVFLGVLL